jgi:uncharacterized protein (DUF433 family)
VIHGRTIELEREPELPDGQTVCVLVQPEDAVPRWLERFTIDPSVAVGELLVKGTCLLAEDLARLMEAGRSDEELRSLHPELTPEDVDAVRQYAKVPAGLRSAFGGWAEAAEELDEYLEWSRQRREVDRAGLEP